MKHRPGYSQRVENGFVIEKGVEVPEVERFFGGSRRRYPWKELRKGESWFDDTVDSELQIKTVRENASRAGKRLGRTFITRTVRDEFGEISGIRIWRIA